MLNKSQQDHHFQVVIEGLNNFTIIGKTEFKIRAGESYNVPLSVAIDPYDLKSPISEFNFVLSRTDEPETQLSQSSKFIKGR